MSRAGPPVPVLWQWSWWLCILPGTCTLVTTLNHPAGLFQLLLNASGAFNLSKVHIHSHTHIFIYYIYRYIKLYMLHSCWSYTIMCVNSNGLSTSFYMDVVQLPYPHEPLQHCTVSVPESQAGSGDLRAWSAWRAWTSRCRKSPRAFEHIQHIPIRCDRMRELPTLKSCAMNILVQLPTPPARSLHQCYGSLSPSFSTRFVPRFKVFRAITWRGNWKPSLCSMVSTCLNRKSRCTTWW